jgi:hypothetical protein
LNEPRKFKAPYNPKERIWQEADRLRAAHSAGRELPVKVLDLAEFDLHLDLVPVNGLREQLDIDALLMGDLKSILVDKRAFMSPRLEYRLRFSVAHEIGQPNLPVDGGYENKPETEGARRDMQEGEPCPKCSTPVVKRKGKWKPSRDYYYEFHLFCPECQTTYHVESAKRFVEQPPSLF